MDTQDRWYYNHLHSIHQKKLELIQSQSSGRIDNSLPETFQLSRTKNFSFKSTKKKEYEDIFKKNQVIMGALNEISNRKKRMPSDNYFSLESLNLNKRKKEIQNIIWENMKIHKSITNKGATLSVKKLDEEYKLSLKYKKNVARKFAESPKKDKKKKGLKTGKDKVKKSKKIKKQSKELSGEVVSQGENKLVLVDGEIEGEGDMGREDERSKEEKMTVGEENERRESLVEVKGEEED